MEDRVIKKTRKSTTRKTTKKAKKEVEVVEAIIDDVDVEENVEVEEVKPRKTVRELRAEFRDKKNEIEVEIINLNSCATVCRDRTGRELFRLNNTGDRDFLTLADIYEVANRHKGMFEKHWIAIIDVESKYDYEIEDILTYLNLDEMYQEHNIENYDTDYISQILKMDVRKFEKYIEEANESLVRMVASRAVDLYRNKKFDSRIKENVLAKRLNREDLFEM